MLSSPITWKEFFEMYYRDELNKIAGKIMCNSDGKYPLNVKAKDLMVFREGKLFEELFKDPIKVIEDATKSLESITTIYPVTLSGENVSVRFVNIPESRRTLVKNLGHKHVGKFVSVVGIVRKISEPSSLVKRVAYVCTRCGNKVEVESRNMVIPKPSYCDNCKKRSKFVVDDDSITRISFQKLKLQDLPEHLEASEIPVFLDAYLTGDLVQSVRAGDKVVLNGILKSDERRIERGSAIESFYLDVNSVELLEKDIRSIRITKEDERKIKELAKDPNIYDKLVKSIAPSILGHDEIKLAIALQLFGGCPIETPDGRIRGDIHILLVGDPSVAKSRLTRAVANIAPRAVLSTGLTSSGAGLTVSVMKDEGGRWNIEAGVLVLADKGLAVIDELEKMSKDDRRYILEALEQQSYHKDTEILLADGRKVRIGEFVDSLIESNRDKVIVGKDTEILPVDDVFVLGYDLNTKKIVITKADRVSRHVAPKKFVRITFSNGRSVTVTPEHPVLVWKDGNIVEVPAEKVEKGCLVPAVRWYETLTKNIISKDLAKLLGHILSDGYTYDRVYEVGFTNTCKNYVEEFKRIASKLNLKFKETKNYTDRKLPLSIVRINSKNFYNRLRNICPEIFAKAKEKRIPYVVVGGSKDIKEAFINGFFKGDGFVDKYRVGLTTTSKAMAEDLHDLLLSIGINSYIYEWKGCYKVVISGYDSILKFSEIVKDDPRYCRILQILERSKNRRNDRDILPKELAEILRDVLNVLRLNDGYLTSNISRNFNAHRKTLKDRLKIVGDVIKAVEDGLNSEDINKKIESAKRVVRLTEVAKGVKYSTLRYRLKKDPTPLLEFAKGRLEDLKRKVDIVKGYIEGNIRFLKVRKVEIIENKDSKWVYDITVEPYHLFVSHGLILHNTITVAKAGIHAVLNSRCSVLATANPKYGNFDRYTPVIDQINIESNLLSRFDLVFVLFDEPNEAKDGKIAEFLLKGVSNSKPEIDTDLLRKYILYAKENVKNVELSDEAFELIKDFYVKLRSSTGDKITITARQLEGLRRLAQASAKVQLRTVATREDAERAIELMKASLSMWALDPETGEIDISYGLSGIGSKTKDKIRLIKNIISEMDNGDGAIYEEVIQKAQELGISQPDAEKILEKLREVGDIYFPRFNRVKLAY